MAERIDRERSRARIERDIETLGGPAYTLSDSAICRYAYTDVYRATLDVLHGRARAHRILRLAGPGRHADRLQRRARTRPAFGVGSHCDSNRNGGKYDGTLGVCTALEVCRLAAEAGDGLPLRLISFLEEEGSGFGQMLLGSRIMLQRVTEEELRETIRDEHGVSFWDSAEAAGYEPARWRESIHALDGLTGWVEVHIEQGRVLQDTGNAARDRRGDRRLHPRRPALPGRADHAGATPMDFRLDAAVPAAETIVELERLAHELGGDVVGTVGEIEVQPGLINVVPGGVRLSLDLRSVSESARRAVRPDRRLRARARRRPAAWASNSSSARSCPCSRWTRASSRRCARARRRAARRSGRCPRAPPTTRSAWPRGCRARWSSSRASTASRTRRSSRPTRPTQRSPRRSSTARSGRGRLAPASSTRRSRNRVRVLAATRLGRSNPRDGR